MKKKQKSKLLSLMNSDDNGSYETTLRDCRKWFKIINEEVFRSSLIPINQYKICQCKGFHGKYQAYYDDEKDDWTYSVITLNKKFKTKKLFVEVLAHEMVHHHQFLFGNPLGHGPSFYKWQPKLNKKGLSLAKAYLP